ncbi:hypothetical protein NO1_0614 [Candidatus Termititenax aidoneus]|uniref:Uncharacterized protein n=1 Tax=Termititenax aidoneus TaxID=2218524 RepID=A0A388TAA0_TERA1|nr:hypothetical protein NO1_0614 [Candidatus Termititenax aidoneus]
MDMARGKVMKIITTLSKDERDSYEVIYNKISCAKQALRANAIPPYAPVQAADRYFREAIFAYADAQYLQEYFWRELARRYGVEQKYMDRLQVDFDTNKLFVKD